MLGQHLIVTYSGRSYPEYIQDRIWDRLNMSSTTFSPTKALHSGKLTEAWSSSGRLIPFWFSEDDVDLMAGAGGLISSVEDVVSIWLSTVILFTTEFMGNRRNGFEC